MKDTLIKLQIKSLEQQLKVLKAKRVSRKEKGKTLSGLFGFFEGKMDMSLGKIRQYEYALKDKPRLS